MSAPLEAVATALSVKSSLAEMSAPLEAVKFAVLAVPLQSTSAPLLALIFTLPAVRYSQSTSAPDEAAMVRDGVLKLFKSTSPDEDAAMFTDVAEPPMSEIEPLELVLMLRGHCRVSGWSTLISPDEEVFISLIVYPEISTTVWTELSM